ncbi:hypothetical protein CE91St49_28270 [Emergencia timonensis]|nr:hypothetical protein CE91St48_28340 [Emergencia timonensis]BDF13480.1 hypothetical protein CE91St49_28270 [Emergencia timonensis]
MRECLDTPKNPNVTVTRQELKALSYLMLILSRFYKNYLQNFSIYVKL